MHFKNQRYVFWLHIYCAPALAVIICQVAFMLTVAPSLSAAGPQWAAITNKIGLCATVSFALLLGFAHYMAWYHTRHKTPGPTFSEAAAPLV